MPNAAGGDWFDIEALQIAKRPLGATVAGSRCRKCVSMQPCSPLGRARGGHVINRAKYDPTARSIRRATCADRILALLRRLHLRDHRFDWRHHCTHSVPGCHFTPSQPLPVPNPDVLDRTALCCGGGGSIHVRPGDRGRHIDFVANLVAGAKRQGVARAERPQGNPRSYFLDVWMKVHETLSW